MSKRRKPVQKPVEPTPVIPRPIFRAMVTIDPNTGDIPQIAFIEGALTHQELTEALHRLEVALWIQAGATLKEQELKTPLTTQ